MDNYHQDVDDDQEETKKEDGGDYQYTVVVHGDDADADEEVRMSRDQV